MNFMIHDNFRSTDFIITTEAYFFPVEETLEKTRIQCIKLEDPNFDHLI